MARNGSGTFSNPYPNFVSGTVISSSQVDANNTDIAAALTQSIAVDGQSTVTGNIPLSTNKLTGVGAGSAATDSLNLGQAQAEAMHWCGTAGGSANAITLSPSPAITAYAAGQRFVWKASGSVNTGATTVAISGLGTIALQDNGAALVAGNHAANKIFMGILDTASTVQVLQVQISGTDPLLVSSLTVSGTATVGGILSVDDTTTSTSGTTGSIHTDGGLGVAGTSTLIGVTTHGGNVVSDTDSTDDLGTTSVRWKELFVDAITATDQVTATGFTGTLDGILGSGTPAAATVTTLNSSEQIIATLSAQSGIPVVGQNTHASFNGDAIRAVTTRASNAGFNLINCLTGNGAAQVFKVSGNGEVMATGLDISGDADIDGTLEADAMTLDGTAITATATLSTGISNNNVPKFTTGVADDDFLRVAGTAIEGRSAAEVLSDIAAAPAAGSANIVTTGALNSGSITSGFGAIDNGSSAITTTGTVSAGALDISGNIDVDGTTNLDAVDIDGAVQIDATLSVGVDDQGYDVKFFGDTASAYMLWDTSADDLILGGGARLGAGTTSPSYLIHQVQAGADTAAEIQTTGGAYGAELRLNSGGASPAAYVTGRGSGTENWRVGSNSQGNTLELKTGANAVSHFTFSSVGAVYNDDSVDLDFRVETNGSANTLFVDGGTDRIGVGTATPLRQLHLDSAGSTVQLITAPSGYTANIFFGTTSDDNSGRISYVIDDENMVFSTNDTEQMRIKTGGSGGTLFVGGTTVRNAAQVSIDYTSASQCGMGLNDTNSGNGGSHIAFLTGGTVRGAITNNNNTAVAYNTTSDARLKENLVPISDAISRVNNLNPVKFNWIGNGSVSEGFIAQEILAGDEQLAADMVTGDPDGDAETAPMQVDYAKITPLLTAALQQALAKIDDLETRLIALEG